MTEITLDEQAIKDLRAALCHRADEDYEGAVARLRALLSYEPSGEDITDYCKAHGWAAAYRHVARRNLIAMRDRGYTAEFRRIEKEN